eukprot:scaffold2335_cov175-Amphora_coffeaeformis.AAC.2
MKIHDFFYIVLRRQTHTMTYSGYHQYIGGDKNANERIRRRPSNLKILKAKNLAKVDKLIMLHVQFDHCCGKTATVPTHETHTTVRGLAT